jgi:hypothetical protein
MTSRPTAELRRQVIERAANCCEYCLLPQDLAAFSHQVDHVIAEKHAEIVGLGLAGTDGRPPFRLIPRDLTPSLQPVIVLGVIPALRRHGLRRESRRLVCALP